MRCYEEALEKLLRTSIPDLTGDDWSEKLDAFLKPIGLRAKIVLIDEPAIISHRLPNGKVHAELMHPTIITTLEKL